MKTKSLEKLDEELYDPGCQAGPKAEEKDETNRY